MILPYSALCNSWYNVILGAQREAGFISLERKSVDRGFSFASFVCLNLNEHKDWKVLHVLLSDQDHNQYFCLNYIETK